MRRFVLFLVLLVPGYLIAGEFADDTAEEFLAGDVEYTEWDDATGSVQWVVAPPAAEGEPAPLHTFRSQTFDAGGEAVWQKLSFRTRAPNGFALPDDAQLETGFDEGNVAMSDNALLLHFDEPTGATSFTDASGAGNDGTCNNISLPCPQAGDLVGVFGKSVRFDGTNDIIKVPEEGPGPISNLIGDLWTIEFWAISSGISEDLPTFGFDGSADFNCHNPVTLYHNEYGANLNGNRDCLSIGDDYCPIVDEVYMAQMLGVGAEGSRALAASRSQWEHYLFVDDGNQYLIYKNGSLLRSGSIVRHPTSSTLRRLTIGQDGFILAYAQPFNGRIDEFAIFKRALTPEQVKEHYRRGAARIKYQVRGCEQPDCGDNPPFVGPGGDSNKYFYGSLGPDPGVAEFDLTGVPAKQFFQYKAYFETADPNVVPRLKQVKVFFEPVVPVCGNGIVQGGEQCDDGNTELEACAYGQTSCTVCGPVCTNQPGSTSFCGDGVLHTANGEQCDDGNQVVTDACLNNCTLNKKADLKIAISQVPPDNRSVGQQFEYRFKVTNNGSASADGLKIDAAFPAGIQAMSATLSGGTCTVTPSTVACTQSALATTAIVELSVKVKAVAAGSMAITGSTSSNSYDENPANNQATFNATIKAK